MPTARQPFFFIPAKSALYSPPAKDEPSEFYQGGTFCGEEYSADFVGMKKKG